MKPKNQPKKQDRIVEIVPTYYTSSYFTEAIEIRTHSFQQMAAYMGMEPVELMEFMLGNMIKSTESLLEYYNVYPIDNLHEMLLKITKESDDYWFRLTVQELYLKTHSIDVFLEFYDKIWEMNNPYLNELAKILPYRLNDISSKDKLYDFLFQIPYIFSFEMDFNTFISISVEGNKVPVIQQNYVLLTVLDYFIETVGYTILETTDNFDYSVLKQLSQIEQSSQDPAIVAAFFSQFKMLQGKSPIVFRVNFDKQASHNLHYSLSNIIFPFVEFHEYGHLFMGHLNRPYSKELEYEADQFAMIYINSLINKYGEGSKFKVFLCLSCFYMLLHLRESILPLSNQHQYPTAKERFLKLGTRLSLEDRRRLAKAWNNVLLAVGYTVKKVYGIAIPYMVTSEDEDSEETA